MNKSIEHFQDAQEVLPLDGCRRREHLIKGLISLSCEIDSINKKLDALLAERARGKDGGE